ncbi:hypothetical protein HDV04_003196 [Boothiomyces sp. JEL0838]|nr:hypothetical protein HDV04_003196 [Boothiomyces sp. JEL0838]
MSLNIAVIGPGLVGSAFISQVKQFQNKKLTLSVIATMNSKKMTLGSSVVDSNIDKFIEYCNANQPCVIVDSTSSESVVTHYPKILQKLHLVTPNKKGFSGSIDLFNQIKSTSLENNTFCYHEATVGAGLPIISTLNDLVQTGDEITKIEGIFSGTLSFIFNRYSQIGGSNVSFSQIVKEAKELGYTEPDPRDDLNGLDVARKVVILGRVSGLPLSLDTLQIENIVPKELREADASTFMEQLSNYDDYFSKLNKEALESKSVLRYVGCVDPNGSSVALKKFDASHPFASLKGSDNIIAFYTKRFPNPLIVQGAGAGAEVTAFGMFSDVLKIAKSMFGPI